MTIGQRLTTLTITLSLTLLGLLFQASVAQSAVPK